MPDIYQLRLTLRDISPLIWRRLLVRSDTAIAQLHAVIQAAMGDWGRLPIPDGPLTVEIDGGFVRARGERRHFEVIIK